MLKYATGVIDMEILQLRYFCDAAVSQNFSKTAKKFGVPPSNISQCIKRLENELGTELFSRKSNSITLSDQGKNFYDKISRALSLIEQAKIESDDKNLRDTITICIIANWRIVLRVIEKFRKKFPQVNFVISHKLDENEDFDFVIADDLFKTENMEGYKIISEEIALAMTKDNPLSQKNEIEISDMEKEKFISMSRDSNLFAITQHFCSSKGFEPNVVIQSDEPFYMRECIELGLGIAFVPTVSWKGMFSDKIVLKHIEGFSRNTYAFRNKSSLLSKTADEFFDMLISEFKKQK